MSDERHVYIGGSFAEAEHHATIAGLGRASVLSSPERLYGISADGLVIHLVGTFYSRGWRDFNAWTERINVLEARGAKVVNR